jgi:hypothetical protein
MGEKQSNDSNVEGRSLTRTRASSLLLVLLIFALLNIGLVSWLATSVLQRLSNLDRGVSALRDLAGNGSTSGREAEERTIPDEEKVQYRTMQEVRDSVKSLGDNPSGDQLAKKLAELDSWFVKPDDQPQLSDCTTTLIYQLRAQVRKEVGQLQELALQKQNSTEAFKTHAEAGRILALYPMSDSKPVVEAAKRLSASQVELAGRIEMIRRQRYNRWAAERIEEAVSYYNDNVKTNPLANNPQLIDPLVEKLGEIDPSMIEPVVLELYNYVLDRTKSSLSEGNKIELAKRLTDPAIKRKMLGDF